MGLAEVLREEEGHPEAVDLLVEVRLVAVVVLPEGEEASPVVEAVVREVVGSAEVAAGVRIRCAFLLSNVSVLRHDTGVGGGITYHANGLGWMCIGSNRRWLSTADHHGALTRDQKRNSSAYNFSELFQSFNWHVT